MNDKELFRRRKQLMSMMDEGSIAIVPNAPVRFRNRDVEFPYRPDSDFFYLTGYNEPESVAVLVPGREQGEFILFCRERDTEKELWNGTRAGLDGACEIFGANDAFPIDDLDDILPGLLENRERVFYSMGCYPEFDHHVLDSVNRVRSRSRAGIIAPAEFIALDHLLHEMRLFKSRYEIKLMQKAASISAAAHRRAMQVCRPGMMEYQLESELLHEFMQGGSRSPAYQSIVGGGANGCVLHYTENSAVLQDGDLVLIDAGAEYEGYASDITRTFPVNGKFRPAQKAIYELVLDAQLAAIEVAVPGNNWNQPHEAAVEVITRGLLDLGLLHGKLAKNLKEQTYRRFYMHRTGHWLGMDVHDVGDYKIGGEWRLLEPGMVLTIEPGLYIAGGSKDVPKKWWNIGVRIEDDVLVTRDGSRVLSADAPKEVTEIEALARAAH